MFSQSLPEFKEKLRSGLNCNDRRAKIQDSDFIVGLMRSLSGTNGAFSLNDLRRGVCSYLGISVGASSFNERLSRPSLIPQLMAAIAILVESIRSAGGSSCATKIQKDLGVKGIVGVDGSLVSLWDGLKEAFPGTFVNAAMKLHLAIDLVSGVMSWFNLTEGSVHDNKRFPPITAGFLYIYDLGYWSIERMLATSRSEAFFLSRVKSGARLTILDTVSGLGKSAIGEDLLSLIIQRSRGAVVEVRATLTASRRSLQVRVIGFWNSENRCYHWYVTNLPATVPASAIYELYRLRWQLELGFKSMKSILNFDHMPTLSPNTATALALISILNYLMATMIRAEAEETAEKEQWPEAGTSSIQRSAQLLRILIDKMLEVCLTGRRMTDAWFTRLRKMTLPLLRGVFDPNYKKRPNTASRLLNMLEGSC